MNYVRLIQKYIIIWITDRDYYRLRRDIFFMNIKSYSKRSLNDIYNDKKFFYEVILYIILLILLFIYF